MSSHHQEAPQLLQAAPEASPFGAGDAHDGPNGANGVARFYDQQTGQIVTAAPVTEESVAGWTERQTQRVGATTLTGPEPRAGDWVITQANGDTALHAQVVVGADFLRRYAPADDDARRLLRALGQLTGRAGAGAYSNGDALARLTTYDAITG